MLKLVGQSSYIHGHWDLVQFVPVIKRVIKKQDIELTLVWKLDTSLDEPRSIEDVSTYTLASLVVTIACFVPNCHYCLKVLAIYTV